MPDLSLGDAARSIGVSVDTLRRWDRDGKIETTRDEGNRRRVPASEVDRLRTQPERHHTGDTLSDPQPLPRRRHLGRGRRGDGPGRDRGRARTASRPRSRATRSRSSAWRRGRRGDRDGQGDVGDGRAGRGAGPMRRALFASLAAVAAIAAGCGSDDSASTDLERGGDGDELVVSARLLAGARVHGLRRGRRVSTPSSRSPAPTTSPRRSARASKPDVYAAANTEPSRRTLQGRAGREAGRLREQQTGARGAGGLGRSTRSTTSPAT